MPELKSICVNCGSAWGANPAYTRAARQLGHDLAGRGIRVIFGGGSVGLMREVADAALARGGEVWGVIPEALMGKELDHDRLTRIVVTRDMHERKRTMFDLADAFIALPGGLGTLDEVFEILTWAQLGFHPKPCGFLNVAGYYDPLLAFLDHAVGEGFLSRAHRTMVITAATAEDLLARFAAYRPPDLKTWIAELKRQGEQNGTTTAG